MEIRDRVTLLAEGFAAAQASFSPHYDDLLREVAQRVDETGSAGKSDIATPMVWKRLRADTKWVPSFLGKADARRWHGSGMIGDDQNRASPGRIRAD